MQHEFIGLIGLREFQFSGKAASLVATSEILQESCQVDIIDITFLLDEFEASNSIYLCQYQSARSCEMQPEYSEFFIFFYNF